MSGGRIRFQVVKEAGLRGRLPLAAPRRSGLTLPTTRAQVRLDYLFVPAPHLGRLTGCDVVRAEKSRHASDHFPLLSELRV